MPGIQGQKFLFQVRFYEDGVLFSPIFVDNVKIYNVEVNGIEIAILTPINVSIGIYRVEWNIPADQPVGTYYDEWVWKAENSLNLKTQRNEFEVLENTLLRDSPRVPKLRGAKRAVGYWGRDPSKRIDSEQIPQKVRVLLQDKLLSRGKDVYFWQQVVSSNPLALLCSCVKDTTDRADTTCSSCYGAKYIPGYTRFFYENLYVSSISAGLVLGNIVLDKDIKPYRMLLDSLSTTGTIELGPILYSNSLNLNWDTKLDGPKIVNTNTIIPEFSVDDITYYPITQINDAGLKPIGIGNIYIRITLTRANLNDRSPEFEILRLRHAQKIEPYIKILRPQIMQSPSWNQYGKRTEQLGEMFWTLPLDFFDDTINQDTSDAKIVENSFYELVRGINTGIRYATTKLKYNEEFGIFTQQSFESRRTQPEEFYSRLVF